jgi:hypothetical protein
MSAAGSPLGLGALDQLWRDLRIDPEWGLRDGRAFTWWGSRFATRVSADAETGEPNFRMVRVRAETDLVRGARTDPRSDLILATVARFASLSGIVRDPADPGLLRLHSSVYIYPDLSQPCAAGHLRILRLAAALQAEEANRIAAAIAEAVGGEPAESPHPLTGYRPEPDEILGLWDFCGSQRGAPSSWCGPEMSALAAELNEPPCLMATGDEDGVTAEYPFLGESSLVTFVTNEDHPSLGPGLLVMLRLPGVMDDGEAATLAMRLNGLERTAETGVAFTGSWCSDEKSVAWVSFFPTIVQQSGLLSLLGVNMLGRAHFIATKVYGDDWTRVPARCALERMAEPEVPS